MTLIGHLNKETLDKEINKSLDEAEMIWKKVSPHIFEEKRSIKSAQVNARLTPTEIPGYPFIENGKPEVAEFIALVLDIRGATKHLTQSISGTNAEMLERVLYETTAINTAGSLIINKFKGGITEYLGDGFLSLFKVENEKVPNEVYSAHNAAKYLLNDALEVVNDIIYKRYLLPNLTIGVGMAYSKAIVTLVGREPNLHPKAIGECVYRASKLSDGNNEIFIDNRLEMLWPSKKGGKLKFIAFTKKGIDFDHYKITSSY